MHCIKEITISCPFGQSEAPKALLIDETVNGNMKLVILAILRKKLDLIN
jgi:hypothetical protein